MKTLLHIPHASTKIPSEYLKDYIVSVEYLEHSNITLSDILLDQLTENIKTEKVIFPYSRLFCDVERFRNDDDEFMSEIGLGACYSKNHELKTIRPNCNKNEILNKYYDKHHEKLTNTTEKILKETNSCCIIDLHSFSNIPLPYETETFRPDVCLGFEDYHFDPKFLLIKDYLESEGLQVSINDPFAGSIVPMKYYKKNKQVKSCMIEFNKKLYLNNNILIENKIEHYVNNILNIMEENHLMTFEEFKAQSNEAEINENINTIFNGNTKKLYTELYNNSVLMLDVVDEHTNETSSSYNYVVDYLKNDTYLDNNFTLPEEFLHSLNSSKRQGFLTPYSLQELTEFNLFKLQDYKIGFAIKKSGEIVAVHNNEPDVKGIGKLMLQSVIRMGGKSLDHFDGFLTAFYSSLNFIEDKQERLFWDDQYAPKKWDYKPLNVDDAFTSVFANEPKDTDDYKLASENYPQGKPCVIFRSIK